MLLIDRMKNEAVVDKAVLFGWFRKMAVLERVRDELHNFMVGVNGTLTFKNNPLASYLSCYPIERVVVETDAPFLAPVPYRGKRNEPAYLTKVVEKLQEVYAPVSYTHLRLEFNTIQKRLPSCN